MEHNYTPKEILHAWNHRKYLSGQTKTKTEANLIAFLDALPTRSALPEHINEGYRAMEQKLEEAQAVAAELNQRLIERTQDMLAKQTELIQEARQAKREARDALAQAVGRMEDVPVREMLDILAEARGDGLYSLDRVRARLIAAAKGEGQAQEVPQAEAKAEPATFEAHGKTWTRHMPGDPCPCDPRASVYVAFKDGTFSGRPGLAVNWAWGTYLPDSEWLIGWRYADEPAKAEAKAFSWADAVPENPAVTEQRKIRQAYDTSKQPAQPTQSQQAWTPAVGDVVRLRSGGPVMTVMDAEGKGEFWCLWFDPCGNKEAMDFPAACLTPAKEGQP